MIYRCKRCEHDLYFGCLPSVSCGIYLFALMGLQAFAISAFLPVVRRHFFPDLAVPWWAWFLIAPLWLVGLALGAIVLNYALEIVEWLTVQCCRCPKCGARQWSRGFTRGFGL